MMRNVKDYWIRRCWQHERSYLKMNVQSLPSAAESSNCAMDLWQVTGNASSLMSSSSTSASREEILKEIRSSRIPSSKSRSTSGHPPGAKSVVLNKKDTSKEVPIPKKIEPDLTSIISSRDHDRENPEIVSHEKSSAKFDSKNKQRKTDNPRKRRNSDTQDMGHTCKALNLALKGVRTSVISASPEGVIPVSRQVDFIPVNGTNIGTETLYPLASFLPEDLSFKGTLSKSPNRNIIQHSSGVSTSISRLHSVKQETRSFFNASEGNPTSSLPLPISPVMDIDPAMNRHLRASTSHRHNTTSKNFVPDSTSTFRVLSSHISPETSHPQSLLISSQLSSTYLHSTYTKRESVIKTNSRSNAPFIHTEPLSCLLTPPELDPIFYRDPTNHSSQGKQNALDLNVHAKEASFESRNEAKRDQGLSLSYKDHISPSWLEHIQPPGHSYKQVSPCKDNSSFTIPCLMSPTGRMHQVYPPFYHQFAVPISLTARDSSCCSITPPSPNSPEICKNSHSYFDSPREHNAYHIPITHPNVKICLPSSKPPPPLPPPQISNHHYQLSRHHRNNLLQNVRGGDPTNAIYYGVPTSNISSICTDLSPINSGSTQYDACSKSAVRWY